MTGRELALGAVTTLPILVIAVCTLIPVILLGLILSWLAGGFMFGWEFANDKANIRWKRVR